MPQLFYLLVVLKDDPLQQSQFINLASSTNQRLFPKRIIAPSSSRDSFWWKITHRRFTGHLPERSNSAAGVSWGCCSFCIINTSLLIVVLGVTD
jgi:hypothetical protein